MRKILVVGGVFNNDGGRSSGYIKKLAESIGASYVINGGTYDVLVHALSSVDDDITHVFWFADVPNDLPKLLPDFLNQNPGVVLIQSKNNRAGKYSRDELYSRMRDSGAELLVEFSDGEDGKLMASVLTAHNTVLLDRASDIDDVTRCLITEFNRIDCLLFPLSKHIWIPNDQHAGAFGVQRKNHIHEGVDLYCERGNVVIAMESGTVIAIRPFTGPIADSPWWNNTICVMVEGASGVINYGELCIENPLFKLSVGDKVWRGKVLGFVETVLKKDKGLPMTMLHLERYVTGTKEPIKEWSLGTPQPKCLLDPTSLLIKASEQ